MVKPVLLIESRTVKQKQRFIIYRNNNRKTIKLAMLCHLSPRLASLFCVLAMKVHRRAKFQQN